MFDRVGIVCGRVLSVALLVLLSGCERAAAPASPGGGAREVADAAPVRRPNVLLVTIDTCRADRIACYDFPLGRTPAIDRLAREGVRCKDAITTAPITAVAHSSILTGLWPPAHGVRDNGAYALSDDVVTLAERLKEAGYSTSAFVSALVLSRRYNLTQGFDSYDDDLWGEESAPLFMIRDRPARKTAQRVNDWLDHWHEGPSRKPFFSWVHFFDPHQPYEPDPQLPNRHMIVTRYDAELASADLGLGRIIDKLEAFGELDNTLVVVTADHGESLGEHNEKTHAIFVYDATVRVPLILRKPGMLPSGSVYEGPVRVIDILPTVLAVLKLPIGDQVQGADLLAALQGRVEPPDLPQYSESLLSEIGFGMAPLFSVRLGGFKYIRAPRPEVYDLKADPRELRNLYESHGGLAEELDGVLEQILTSSQKRAPAARANPLDQETLSMLRALGYIAAVDERESMKGMDPKDGIELYNMLEEARHLGQLNRWAEAEPLLREMIARTPQNLTARNVLGICLMRQDRLDEARLEYLASLAVEPRQHRVEGMLGAVAIRQHNLDLAEQHYRKALEVTPRFVEAMVHLGFIALQRGDQAAAEEWYHRAMTEDPSYPRVYHNYADLYFVQGDYASALTYYRKALEVVPYSFDALNQAGLSAMKLADPKAALDYFARAERVRPESWVAAYNIACVHSVSGQLDRALEELERAIGLGFANVQQMEHDRDFDAIRDCEEFSALARKLRERPLEP